MDLDSGFRLINWDVSPRQCLISDGARRIRLEPKTMAVLVCLATHSDRVVTRDDFVREVWLGRVVGDEVLSRCISLLRSSLGDDARTPRFIQTLPKIGYRLIAKATALESATAAQPVSSDLTPARHEQGNGSTPRMSRARAATLATFIGLALVAVGGAVGWIWSIGRSAEQSPRTTQASRTSAREASIAVLPFVNMTSDAQNEPLADGLSEELLNTLSGIRGLKVAGRTSSFYYKGRNERPAVIAQALKVNHLLEGSVRRDGSRVRITVQLIDANAGYHLWSHTYDRDLTDVFATEEEIARAVAAALQIKLASADELRLARTRTRDAQAYEFYLAGRARLLQRKPDDLRLAKELFERAIARDPQFAAAYSGLATTYAGLLWNSPQDPDIGEVTRLGQSAAERAIALDPQSSESYLARAVFERLRYEGHGDTQANVRATMDFHRALDADPTNALAYHIFGYANRWDDLDLSQRLYQRALEIDPLLNRAQFQAAIILRARGQYDEARRRFEDLIENYPGASEGALSQIAIIHWFSGHLDAAATAWREVARVAPNPPDLFYLWSLYMDFGDSTAAESVLRQFGAANPFAPLGAAASLSMSARYAEASETLERGLKSHEELTFLSLPAAHFALIAGKPRRTVAILAQRMPGLLTGEEPINSFDVAPALDLATAWLQVGESAKARNLLQRLAAFLDGPKAPRLPLTLYFRGATHALSGELDLAMRALDEAYAQGFRTTWGGSFWLVTNYCPYPVSVDPRLGALRSDPRFKSWLARIDADNHRQWEQLKVRVAGNTG